MSDIAPDYLPKPTVPAPSGSGPTGVVPAATLDQIQLPKPKAAPKGIWSAADATRDGNRLTNYTDEKSVIWVGVQLVDCNLPAAKDGAGKPGPYESCGAPPVGKVKGSYPLFGTTDQARTVKAGHLLIIAGIGAAAPMSFTTKDLEAFFETLDLDAFAKL